MSFVPPCPALLAHADLVMVRFTLEFLSPCRLSPYALLGLRQGLLRSGRELFGEQADRLFTPALSSDVAAVKRFQKPSPAFVLRPQLLQRTAWEEGDAVVLEVLFLGAGVQQIQAFGAILQHLGGCGLLAGEGVFEISAACCRTASGGWRRLPLPGRDQPIVPDVLSIGMWLDSLLPLASPLVVEVLTPARLLTDGRALRRPRFDQLFPFMLRRVTSMLYYHCNLEPVDEPARLLAAAKRVGADWQSWCWVDWRELPAGRDHDRVGGLTGQLLLGGDGVEELGWVVAIATLFGIGRGAAFGAGRLRLVAAAGE